MFGKGASPKHLFEGHHFVQCFWAVRWFRGDGGLLAPRERANRLARSALDEIHTGENKGPKSLQLSDNQATAAPVGC